MNKKGFTVIELIVSFALTTLVVALLFQMLLSLKDIYVNSGVRTQMLNKQTIMSNKINSDFENKKITIALKCGYNCLTFYFDDNTSKKLIIDTASSTFTYGDYVTKLADGSSFGAVDVHTENVLNVGTGLNDSFITIKIPVKSSLLKEDYGVNIVYQYDSRTSSISSITFDATTTVENKIFLKGSSTTYLPNTETYIEPGYYVITSDGVVNDMDSNVTVTGTVGSAVGSTYTLTYTLRDAFSAVLDVKTRNVTVVQSVYNFSYTGAGQTFTAPVAGNYKVELWGGQGGSAGGGKGGYTSGNIYLDAGTTLYPFVGQGSSVTSNGSTFNGGTASGGGYPGGGATDIRYINKKYRYVQDYLNGSNINADNHWVEIEVWSGGTNVALGKPVAGSVAEYAGTPYSRITDGDLTSANYARSSVQGLQGVEIDLGAEYEIDYVKVYHFYNDARIYNGTHTFLNNTDRTRGWNIFYSDWTGTYAESASGLQSDMLYWKNIDGLRSRIMVAAGGGAGAANKGGSAGGLTGNNGANDDATYPSTYEGFGGSQTSSGLSTYGATTSGFGYSNAGCAGGGGYYGGGGALCNNGGGGGSSFISGYPGVNAINSVGVHTNQTVHFSGLAFSSMQLLSGAATMPAVGGGVELGHGGNGAARITLLSNIATENIPLTSVEVLVVAGGGGGSGSTWGGGGGGAGGILYKKNHTVATGNSISVTVGGGGAASAVGGASFFGSLQAFGGGPANGSQVTSDRNGGSGGGGGHMSPSGLASSSIQTSNNGGVGFGNGGGATNYVSPYPCGSGGGAGTAGSLGGIGGMGRAFDISGAETYYAGGGGTADNVGTTTAGGLGGGGNGSNAAAGVSGTANTGGGGGGSRGGAGGAGGSGVVIVRYPGPQKATGGTVTSVNGFTIHTFFSGTSNFVVW